MFKKVFNFLGDIGKGIYTVTKEGLQFIVNLPADLRDLARGIDQGVRDTLEDVGAAATPNERVVYVGGAAIPVPLLLAGAGLLVAVFLLARK